MEPLIGVTASSRCLEEPGQDWLYIPHDYFRAIRRAGGIPVMLPLVADEAEAARVLDRLDGLLLSGGDDLDPSLYGELPLPGLGMVDPARDAAELAYARVAVARDMPTLGICRGHQVLAVAFGGTLWQDLPSQVPGCLKHKQQAPKDHPTHPVSIAAGTRLAALLGAERRVNSRHHQAVKRVPDGWVESAVAPDGVNEAMEHPGRRFALSVQWHPENHQGRPYNFDPLFDAFIAAAVEKGGR
ncbi:gamma-glutamyl-gamma-aminobutyrate hydrolase family protein [Symbiobacterium terraclitae]|uniref:gamma-glutamyl-gamma-aminobutyrate hydrolase family protein n=1 Tax=Symbiobacterium terraclitae TaxID=557451 RepID=UPI0035B56DFE